VLAHRLRGLSPDGPVLRGSAQNPDVFFQAREAANPFYDAVPDIVQQTMDDLADRTVVRTTSSTTRAMTRPTACWCSWALRRGGRREAVAELNRRDERVGLLTVRLYRPFPSAAVRAALPPTVRRLAVLDRTKEPGASGEPLFTDVATTLVEAATSGASDPAALPRLTGGRYGLSSKEFTPAMVAGVFAAIAADDPPRRCTVGINDDVTHLSVPADTDFSLAAGDGDVHAVFFGLGSDGPVGANKNTVEIVGEHTDLNAQGYFVYDSRKSGAQTVSHLRFSPRPITSTYLIDHADFVACHQFGFLGTRDVLGRAAPGATVLLNVPFPAERSGTCAPRPSNRRSSTRTCGCSRSTRTASPRRPASAAASTP
jgi:pyruvate-ferredoxin/flavodoxin oxidoreductase